MSSTRRHFLLAGGIAGLSSVAPLVCQSAVAVESFQKADKEQKPAEEVSATEDLMREHGVLNRVLLIYEEGLRRLRNREEIAPEVFQHTAHLVRKFVEDYHEKLEENFIFPEFEKQQKLTDLVKVLRRQHEAGRVVTDIVLREAARDRFSKPDNQKALIAACQDFIRMYRPHEAREDTVLFPTFRKIVPAKKLDELGEKFEKEEDRLFGEEGFEKVVEQVAGVEKQLGIYNLEQFTPKLAKK
jgi:hemerythrin-like domain-containing protein